MFIYHMIIIIVINNNKEIILLLIFYIIYYFFILIYKLLLLILLILYMYIFRIVQKLCDLLKLPNIGNYILKKELKMKELSHIKTSLYEKHVNSIVHVR